MSVNAPEAFWIGQRQIMSKILSNDVAYISSWAVGMTADGADVALRVGEVTVLMRIEDAEEFAAALTSEIKDIQEAKLIVGEHESSR